MKQGRFHLPAIVCLAMALSVTSLFVSVGSGAVEIQTVYRPDDDMLPTMSYEQAGRILKSKEGTPMPIPPGLTAETYNVYIYKRITVGPDRLTWTEDLENGNYSYVTAYFKGEVGVWPRDGQFHAGITHGWDEPHGRTWKASDARKPHYRVQVQQ